MLELMRRHARNWIMKLLLGIIIVVFVFYFGSIGDEDQADIIATIDGNAIFQVDFQREYEKLLDLLRERYGRNLTDEQLKVLNLKEQAVDNLIKQAIVMKKAEELEIRVSDAEVRDAILSYPAFQRNGLFDQRIYEQTLRLNRMSPDNFEAQQRKLLITKKVEELISSGVHVSEKEVFDLYRLQKETINVKFLKLSLKSYTKGIKPDRQALESYLKERGDEFRIPEQFQVKYISFPAADFAAYVKITESDIKEYYERNKERLAKSRGQPPTLREAGEQIAAELRRISGMALAAEQAKKALDAIYQQENFDAYASGKGLKIKTSAFFPASGIPQELGALNDLSKNVLSLRKNEISRVLSDNKGYYLFQIAAKKPPYIPDLKEAEREVESRYLENEAGLLCRKEAENLLERLKKGEELEIIAREKKIKVEETGMFLPRASIPNLGVSQQLSDALVQLSEAKPYPDKVFRIGDNFVISRFKERGKLDEGDFQAQKGELKKIFKELKNNETINAWIEGVKNSLAKEGRLKITKDIKGN
ncbi:MAG: SurA N-terminal domain-containing protein [Syntrophales bacterium]|nr:SurA N-terminal domain-containing protein [Syntrophales bacterium]